MNTMLDEVCLQARAKICAQVDYLATCAEQATHVAAWMAEDELGLEHRNRDWNLIHQRRLGAFTVYQHRARLFAIAMRRPLVCG